MQMETNSRIKRQKYNVLCKFWNIYSTQTTFHLAKAFSEQVLLMENTHTSNYDSCKNYLESKEIVVVTKKCLMRIYRLACILHGTRHISNVPGSISIHSFLQMFIIIKHTSRFFESMGPFEMEMKEIAQKLYSVFETIIKATVDNKTAFHQIPHEITKSLLPLLFKYQNLFPKCKIIHRPSIVERIKKSLKQFTDIHNDYVIYKLPPHPDIWGLIQRHRKNLSSIGGENDLREFDKENVLFCIYDINEYHAHEILLNPLFKITEDYFDWKVNKKKTIQWNLYWEKMTKDLQQQPPSYFLVLEIIEKISLGIGNFVDENMEQEVKKVINMNMIKKQIDTGILDWNGFIGLFEGIFNVIQKVQSPMCDLETKRLWDEKRTAMENASSGEQSNILCSALEMLYGFYIPILTDAVNSRLQSRKPTILENGIEYEQQKIQEKLKNGIITLQRTRAWLKESLSKLADDSAFMIENGDVAAYVKAYGTCLVDLIDRKTFFVPETLELDILRLRIMRKQYEVLVAYSIVLVTVKQFKGMASETGREFVAQRDLMEDHDWKKKCISIGGAAIHANSLESYTTLVQKRLEDSQEVVHMLMRSRVRAIWEYAVGGARVVNEELQGAEEIRDLVKEWANGLARVAQLNWKVHGIIYNSLISDLILNK